MAMHRCGELLIGHGVQYAVLVVANERGRVTVPGDDGRQSVATIFGRLDIFCSPQGG